MIGLPELSERQIAERATRLDSVEMSGAMNEFLRCQIGRWVSEHVKLDAIPKVRAAVNETVKIWHLYGFGSTWELAAEEAMKTIKRAK
jgi:hypothetical protein